MLNRYQAIAPKEKLDPPGWGFLPLGYAAGQVLAEAVEGAKTLDQVKLAQYMHTHSFNMVMGEIS